MRRLPPIRTMGFVEAGGPVFRRKIHRLPASHSEPSNCLIYRRLSSLAQNYSRNVGMASGIQSPILCQGPRARRAFSGTDLLDYAPVPCKFCLVVSPVPRCEGPGRSKRRNGDCASTRSVASLSRGGVHSDGSCQKGLGGFGGVGSVIPDLQRGAGDKNLVVAAILKHPGRPGYNLDLKGDWRYGHLRYHQSPFHAWKPNRGHFVH